MIPIPFRGNSAEPSVALIIFIGFLTALSCFNS